MRISDKEWENIDFRRKKYKQLRTLLDEAVTGRDNRVSAFVQGENGRYSTSTVDKLVDELIKSMDEYARRHLLWHMGPDDDPDGEAHMPERFREFMSDYLYCSIRLMLSDMGWVWEIFARPLRDSFQQILLHSATVKKLAVMTAKEKFDELWDEAYNHSRGDHQVFDIFTIAYEALTERDIRETLTPGMEARVKELCLGPDEACHEFLEVAEENGMSDEEVKAALAPGEQYYPEGYDPEEFYSEEEKELYRLMDEARSRFSEGEEKFSREFADPDVYCERYIRLREIFYMEADTSTMEWAFYEFDDLVEGMIDVFLCRRGMSLYADVKEFVKSYTVIKKQIDRIKDLHEEV